jgi:transposase
MEVLLRYTLRRVDCPRCGVVIEMVPWAEPKVGFTRDFEDHVAYLAQQASQTMVAETMRIAWRTVGAIIQRVVPRHRDPSLLLKDLEHIGVDELSYRRHHEYVTVVVDHVSQRVVWAHEAIQGRVREAVGLQKNNARLYRGYLLKTAISDILGRRQVNVVKQKLEEWISWVSRSRLPSFKKVAGTIKKYLDGIVAIVATGLNNGRTEGLNGKIRVITRRAYGFHNAQALIGFIFLCCSGVILHPVFKMPTLP